ncbi:MAG TPA: hypothetical protein VK013_10530 [Myxococcaceae bacterium]|nr:hypothetical protein [Myxococcaceae bacterium]
MKILGVLLIVLGALGLAFKAIPYTERQKLIDVGPVQANVDVKKEIAIPPVVAGGVLAVGVVLVLLPSRKRR